MYYHLFAVERGTAKSYTGSKCSQRGERGRRRDGGMKGGERKKRLFWFTQSRSMHVTKEREREGGRERERGRVCVCVCECVCGCVTELSRGETARVSTWR